MKKKTGKKLRPSSPSTRQSSRKKSSRTADKFSGVVMVPLPSVSASPISLGREKSDMIWKDLQ
jgi:hypothetical protein